MTVKLEEKAALYKEIGLNSQGDVILANLEMERMAKELTDMKFKVTNLDEIKEKLQKRVFDPDSESVQVIGMLGFLAIVFVPLIVGGVFQDASHPFFPYYLKALAGVVSAFGLIVAPFLWQKTDVRSMSLYSWESQIPYGGLLAIKEAKARGLAEFEIFYPVKASTQRRLMADPVIVGYKTKKETKRNILSPGYPTYEADVKTGPMIEIFAWDDGKVYE